MQSEASPLRNPFALLNLSADAGPSQIKSAAQEVVFRKRLEQGQTDEQSLHRTERAVELLKDPVARIEHSLFWVTLDDQELAAWKQDPVLSRLGEVWDCSCIQRYESLKQNVDLSRYSQNMAVLSLGNAMHASEHFDEGGSVSDCESKWKAAFQYWSLLVSRSDYWGSILVQCVESGDPRLDSQHVQKWKSNFAYQLLSLCRQQASAALLRGDLAAASAFVGVIRSSAFAEHAIEGVLREVYSPLCKRIQGELEDYSRQLDQIDHRDGSASAYKSLFSEFRKKTYPRLKLILSIGDLPGLDEELARDNAARFLRSLSISVYNNVSDEQLARAAIDLATEVVDSEAMSKKLREDQGAIKHNAVANKAIGLANRSKYQEAIALLDAEIRKGGEVADLQQLRKEVRSAFAGYCFKQATECIEAQQWAQSENWLRKALEYEENYEHRMIMQMGLKKVQEVRKRADSSCFVATATYGTPHHETVVRLRAYRDDILRHMAWGRVCIRLYWMIGPGLAWVVRRAPITRRILSPLLTWMANRLPGARHDVP